MTDPEAWHPGLGDRQALRAARVGDVVGWGSERVRVARWLNGPPQPGTDAACEVVRIRDGSGWLIAVADLCS